MKLNSFIANFIFFMGSSFYFGFGFVFSMLKNKVTLSKQLIPA